MGPTARLFCYPKQSAAARGPVARTLPPCAEFDDHRAATEETKNGRMLVAETGQLAQVERLIAPSLAAMGYEIVRVRLSGGSRPTLQIMAERTDGAEMTVDGCVDISRAVSAILDVEDPIAGAYVLEVSSPGIEPARPLTRPADFARFAGHEVKLEAADAVDGRKRFRGRIVGLEGENVRIAAEDGERVLPVAVIRSAKLVLTDALVAESLKRRDRQ